MKAKDMMVRGRGKGRGRRNGRRCGRSYTRGVIVVCGLPAFRKSFLNGNERLLMHKKKGRPRNVVGGRRVAKVAPRKMISISQLEDEILTNEAVGDSERVSENLGRNSSGKKSESGYQAGSCMKHDELNESSSGDIMQAESQGSVDDGEVIYTSWVYEFAKELLSYRQQFVPETEITMLENPFYSLDCVRGWEFCQS